MNRIDGVILGVGIVVLAASVIGVVLYDEEGGSSFDVTFRAGSPASLGSESQSGGPSSYTFEVPVNGTNIASLVFTVDGTTNGLRVTDDQVSVSVSGPDGLSGDCSFTMAAGPTGAGTCDATVQVQDAPPAETRSGADAEAAAAAAEAAWASRAGTGVWTVTVSIAGGTAPVAGSYTVAVDPQVVVYEAMATPPAPAGAAP